MCGSFETELKQKFKWLGKILSSKGLADSVTETVSAREGKIRGACLEIAKIVNDWRAKVPGGMATALVLCTKPLDGGNCPSFLIKLKKLCGSEGTETCCPELTERPVSRQSVDRE